MLCLFPAHSLRNGFLLSILLVYFVQCSFVDLTEAVRGVNGEQNEKTTDNQLSEILPKDKSEASVTGLWKGQEVYMEGISDDDRDEDQDEGRNMNDEVTTVETSFESERKGTTAIKPTQIEVPSPTNIDMFFINITAVNLTWNYSSGGDDPLPICFFVQLSSDGGPYQNVSKLLSQRYLVFDGMTFAGYYKFQVVAYFEGLVSKPTATDFFVNGVTAPPGPPTNVRALIMSPSELKLQWDGPKTPTPLFYIIYWGEDPDNLKRVTRLYRSTHVSFQDLEPNSTLYFRLRADISARLSVLSEMVCITMPAFSQYVMCTSCHPLSSTQLLLGWQVKGDVPDGGIDVEVYSLVHNNYTSIFNMSITQDDGNLTLNNLQPWTMYSLALSFSSPPNLILCPITSCMTLESVPSGPPLDLKVINTTSHSASLQWTPPLLENQNGKLTHYLFKSSCHPEDLWVGVEGVWYLNKEEEIIDKTMVIPIINSSINKILFTLTGLHPFIECTFQVATATREGKGPYSLGVNASTSDEVLNLPESLILHVTTDNYRAVNGLGWCGHYIILTWTPLLSYQGNSTSDLHNVLFSSYFLASLMSLFCFSILDDVNDTSNCMSLDSIVLIMENHYKQSSDELFGHSPFSGQLLVWIELKAQLINGTLLNITSERRDITQCFTNATSNDNTHWKVILIFFFGLVLLTGSMVVLVTPSVICIWKRLRRRQTHSTSEMILEDNNFQSQVVTDNENVPSMRVGDGRSCTSSQQSISSEDVTEDLSIITDTSSIMQNESATLISNLSSSMARKFDGYEEFVGNDQGMSLDSASLGVRDNPDGYSISSGEY